MKHLTQIFQALLGVVTLIFTAIIAFGRLAWRTIRNWWKNRSKWLRRSIVAIFIIVPVGFVALVAYALYDDAYGRDYMDKRLSDNVILRSFADDTYRVYNKLTNDYTTSKIEYVSDMVDDGSLAVYVQADKCGYVDIDTGQIVIDAAENDYSAAWDFREGLAAVMRNGKIGFINTNNEVVIPFQFERTPLCDMEIYFIFHNGYCSMTIAEGKVGLIDREGKWIVEPIFDELWAPSENGCRIIVNDGKYGVLDEQLNIAYPTEYDHIDITADGVVLTKDGHKWKVDYSSNIIQPYMVDFTLYLKYPTGYDESGEIEYAFADYLKYEVNDRYGIMSRITGEPITPAIYSDINMLSEDLFEVQDPESYDWYLVDTQGNVISKR